jgi:hypothetical protein
MVTLSAAESSPHVSHPRTTDIVLIPAQRILSVKPQKLVVSLKLKVAAYRSLVLGRSSIFADFYVDCTPLLPGKAFEVLCPK